MLRWAAGALVPAGLGALLAANSNFPRVTVGKCEAKDTRSDNDSVKKAREDGARANTTKLPAGTVTTVTTVTPPVSPPAESFKKSTKTGGSDAKKESDADIAKSAPDLMYKHLLNQRIILLTGRVDDKMANAVVQALLYLAARDPVEPIQMYICSAGGSVFAAMAIIDMMAAVAPPVHTAVFGHAESAAAIILGAGEKGHRCVSPHSRVMIHQPYTTYSSVKFQDRDMIVRAEELARTRLLLEELVSEYTGKPLVEIKDAMTHNTYLNAAESVAFGIADIMCSSKHAPGPARRGK